MESDDGEGGTRPWPLQVFPDAFIEFAHEKLRDGETLAVQIPRPAPGPGFRDDTGHHQSGPRKRIAYPQHTALVYSLNADEGITPALPQQHLNAFHTARAQGIHIHAQSHFDLLVFHKTGKADPRDSRHRHAPLRMHGAPAWRPPSRESARLFRSPHTTPAERLHSMTILDPPTSANPAPAATLMTPEHLAEYLGVTPRWVYNNHQKLGIPAFQIGRALRFRRGDVDAWLDTRRTG